MKPAMKRLMLTGGALLVSSGLAFAQTSGAGSSTGASTGGGSTTMKSTTNGKMGANANHEKPGPKYFPKGKDGAGSNGGGGAGAGGSGH
jgi:hypothetical protein